jgi:uncharacterized protein (DUF58 family)
MPGKSIVLQYRLTCPRRGYHRIGPLMMESGDVFGLQKRFRTGVRQDYVSVLPTIAYIETFNIAARRPQGPVRVSNRIYEDPTKIVGIRECIPGDPMNRIHWKVSARNNRLYSKVTAHAVVTGGTLILDFLDGDYLPERKEERMERAVTTPASIAYLLQMWGEQVGLLTKGRDAAEEARYEIASQHALSRRQALDTVAEEDISTKLSPLQVATLRSPVQAQKIAENLARIVPCQELSMDNLILSEYIRLPRDAALLPVVPQVTAKLALTLAAMKNSGFNVTVFLIDAGAHHIEAATLLAQYQIATIHIQHERDLHELSPAAIGQ